VVQVGISRGVSPIKQQAGVFIDITEERVCGKPAVSGSSQAMH
jgi:hypothetical protein